MGAGVLNIFNAVVHTLSPVHYFAFFIAFFAWVFILIVTYALRANRIVFILLSLFATFTFLTGPFISYFYVESYVKSSQIADLDTKQLTFVDKVVTRGNLTNTSRRILKECRILSYAVPAQENIVTGLKKSIAKGYYASVSIEKELRPGETAPFYTTISGITDYALFDLHHFTFCK